MPKKLYSLLIVFLLLALGLHAENVVDEIVARVNDSIITRADLEKGKHQAQEELKQSNPTNWQSKWSQREKDVLRDLIDRQLLLDRGKDLGITGETRALKVLDEMRAYLGYPSMEELAKAVEREGISYQDFQEQTRDNIVSEEVLGAEVGSHLHITNAEVQAWYQAHQKELALPESVKLAEILISVQPSTDNNDSSSKNTQVLEDPAKVAAAQAKANDVRERLRQGADFGELARKYSDGPTASQNGEMSDFKRGEMAPELEARIFTLRKDEISDVLRTRQGFIIFKVLEHRQAGVPAIKDVEEKIRNIIYAQKLDPAARAYLTKLRQSAYIEVRQGFVDTGAGASSANSVVTSH